MKSIHKTLLSVALCGLVACFYVSCNNDSSDSDSGSNDSSARQQDPIQLPTETLSSGLTAFLVGQSCGDTDVSVAIDGSKQVHIIYKNDNGGLVYAKKTAEGWFTNGFDVAEYRGYGCWNSLALDQAGNVHISCSANDHGDEDLIYITNKSGEWRVSGVDVEDSQSIGLDNSIAVDKNGVAHIGYRWWNSGGLCYASNEGGQWQFNRGLGSYYYPQQIVIDKQGAPHIIYLYDDAILHQWKVNGAWKKEEVGESGFGYYFLTTATIDQNDNLYALNEYVLYINRGNGWRKQYTREDMVGDSLDSFYIDGIDKNAMAVDYDGSIHFCYYSIKYYYADDSYADYQGCESFICYVSNAGGSFKVKVIDSWPSGEQMLPRLAVDNNGNVHLVYASGKDAKIRYVTFNKNDLR